MSPPAEPTLRDAILAALEAGPLSPVALQGRIADHLHPIRTGRNRPPPHPATVLHAELLRMWHEDLVHPAAGLWHLGARPA